MADSLTELQDVFGPLMRAKLFTPICVCFPLQAGISRAHILDTLTKGLEKIAANFPWLAGQVARHEGNGLPTIIPGDGKCRLIVKDLTDDPSVLSFEDMKTARFPYSMLDGAVLTPIPTLPTSWDDEPVPVFFIQANFTRGGLLLTFMGEHSAMDGVGLGHIVHLFSNACRGDSFTDKELSQGNQSRRDIVSLLDAVNYQPGPELEHLVLKSEGRVPYRPPKCQLGYFYFSHENLSKLKSLASTPDSLSNGKAAPYITTNDAVSAFIWKSTARMRAAHLQPDSTSMFIRAVDIRPYLSISQLYLGNMTHHTYTKLPVSDAGSIPLSTVATNLRLALNATDLAYGLRSLLTLVHTPGNRSKASYGADINMKSDIWFSSWAKLDCYHLDFGLGLGMPEAVRKPKLEVIEGLMYLMPMDRKGGIVASICLMEEDMVRLKADPEWLEYAEWIG